MKTILVLFASYKKNGNTFQLLNFYLKQLKKRFSKKKYEIKFYNIYTFKIMCCVGCEFCKQNFGCYLNRFDHFLKLVELIKKCDYFILAAPVFFSGYPSKLKSLIDRSEQFFFRLKMLKFKHRNFIKGDLILTGGNLSFNEINVLVKSCKRFFNCLNINFRQALVAPKTDFGKFCFLIK